MTMSQTPATGVVMTAQTTPGFHCTLQHGPSGTTVSTEAPKDNGGTGMSFSPTDLMAAALASCTLTTMALAASRENIPFGDARARVEKRMTAAPRRIGELVLEIDMPAGLSAAHRARLEEVAHGCPVSRSLHPDVKLPMSFRYPDAPR
jgi:putative redox protein